MDPKNHLMLPYTTMRPRFNDPSDPRNDGGIQGLPGFYEVIFTLSRPGFSLLPEERLYLGGDLPGDSHLSFVEQNDQGTSNPTEIQIETKTEYGHLTFRVIPNKQGSVGKIQIDSLQANNVRDAERKAYQAIAPELSNLSAYFDIPLHIYQVDIIEMRTGMVTAEKISPFQEIIVSGAFSHALPKDYRKYASFYQEAVNCNSPN